MNEANDKIVPRGERSGAADYLTILFFALYFAILFAERLAAVIVGFVSVRFYADDDPAQWYSHIATLAALVSSLPVALSCGAAARFLFTRRSDDFDRIDFRRLAVAAGLILVGGMAHTEFTLLGVQFAAYGCLLLSMLLRTLSAAKLRRPDVGAGRLAVSYLYLACFSMAIPVVYGTSIAAVTAFVTIEAVTALVLVAAFAFMLSRFMRSGGLVNFGIPLLVFTTAADITIVVMRSPETVNYFLIVFLVLTVALWIAGRAAFGNRVLLYFGGKYARKKYFEGWYVKFVTADGEAVALIPSFHADADGNAYSMLQVAGERSFGMRFPADALTAREDMFSVKLGDSEFGAGGAVVDAEADGHKVCGEVAFGKLTPPRRDIMGPFASFPFMECKHGVISVMHSLSGKLCVDGKVYDLDGGTGYIEKDMGRSFPSSYLWTQGTDGRSSVMISVAEIPYFGLRFTGCISFAYTGGREYRLATYRLARASVGSGGVTVSQGGMKLTAEPLAEDPRALLAPSRGGMERTIHESPSAEVRYTLCHRDETLLAMTCRGAGYETG